MKIAIIYIVISVLLSANGQLLLKNGMNDLGPMTLNMKQIFGTLWRMGTNPYVFFGLVIYVVGVVLWLAALSLVDLSYAYPFASLSYIVMVFGAWIFFGEHISLLRIIGTMIVCLGVLLIARS